MLADLHRLIGRQVHDTEARLARIDSELARGWSSEAFADLSALAEGGLANAQYRLAGMYENGDGVVQNLADAVHWYRCAAVQNHVKAQTRLGLIFFIDPPPPAGISGDRLPAAFNSKVTAPGSPAASSPSSQLGSTIEASFPHGFAVQQDYFEAARWNRLAANAGVAESQARYAHQLAQGLGVGCDPAEALRYFHAAAIQDDASGETGLGILLAGGYGGIPRKLAAIPWLQRAAAKGNTTAQYWLAKLKLETVVEPSDIKSALGLLRRAADEGHSLAMYRLGVAYLNGDGGISDSYEAETWLRRSASRGLVDAKLTLGELLLGRGGNDVVEAASWIRQAAEAGDRRAAALLAELYLVGRDVPIDLLEAGRWLSVAGAAARSDAYTALANLHVTGYGGTHDYSSAARWLLLAARRGSVAAKFNLASLHGQGKGVPQDPAKAANWYREAAVAGNAQAAFYLAMLYADEDLPFHDYAAALKWFRHAMLGGHGPALCNFALLLISGRGVSRDLSLAIRILEDGANACSLDAAELLVDLSASGEHIVPAPERVLKYLLRAVELGSVVSARILAEGHIHGFNWEFEKHNVRKVLEFHAKAGDSEAQRALGHLLCRDGNPGDEAFVAGHSWFALAADAGDADAQAWIGDGCKTGLIGRRDEREAEQWYRKAAGQGHFGALLELGLLLEKYEGAEWDLECFGIWLAAASYGSNLAQRKVGVCYLEGKGCDCDAGAATRWFQAAADQGDREAQYLLGRCFRDGIGVERSETMAKMWLERAHHKLQIG